MNLSIKLRRLDYKIKLGLERREEFMAEIRDLFFVPLVSFADLADRAVGDGQPVRRRP